MRPEVASLVLSLVLLLLIPIAVVFLVWLVRRCIAKAAVPASELLTTGAVAIVITVMITLVICLVFRVTGFFEGQFYRPAQHDHGMQERLDFEFEPVRFQSADGTALRGWWLPSTGPTVGTVLYLQGSDLNISYTTRHVSWLTNRGLQVFVFDYRGYGESGGAPSRGGIVDDGVAAIDYVAARSDVDPGTIVLFGQSMGGQVALNAASMRTASGIQLVIAEATYARQSYHLSDKLGRMGPLWLLRWAAWLLTSDDFSGEAAIAKLGSMPVLLVHGAGDTGVSPYHSERLYLRAAGPREIWRYEGYGHLRIFDDESNRERLVEHIRSFLPK